jgi:hypothetical protein
MENFLQINLKFVSIQVAVKKITANSVSQELFVFSSLLIDSPGNSLLVRYVIVLSSEI